MRCLSFIYTATTSKDGSPLASLQLLKKLCDVNTVNGTFSTSDLPVGLYLYVILANTRERTIVRVTIAHLE